MSMILHCGVNRRAKAYWLKSENNPESWDVLLEARCRQCRKTVYETYTHTPLKPSANRRRLKPREASQWLKRLKTDLEQVIEATRGYPKNTRGQTFVGQYTQRVSRGADYGLR